jgi:hypothetical protein
VKDRYTFASAFTASIQSALDAFYSPDAIKFLSGLLSRLTIRQHENLFIHQVALEDQSG